MKRHLRFVFTTVLALALSVSVLVVPALAYSEITTGTGMGFIDIEVEYRAPTDNRDDIEAGAEGTRVYRVTLDWEPTGKIIYNAGNTTYSWNDNDLKYDTEVSGKGWTVNEAKLAITAKNRSNRPVDVACSNPTPIKGVDLTGSYDRAFVSVPSAATGGFDGVGTEQSAKIIYTVGSVSGDISADTKNIASITVTVTGK